MGIEIKNNIKNIATNRKARYEYHILDTYEAGLVLKGTEVKSLREGKVSLRESFAQFEKNELYITNMHISPYRFGNIFNVEPKRKRKLLLHQREIKRLKGQIEEKGLTLIPLRIYFKRGNAKIELALAKGKKLYDKRHALAEKDAQREVERELKNKKWGR
ncbi:MAG: SsrA-binding protein SmpB [Candidatus Caldatribacteriota bacterium]|nr:SsrA-binding protein SmpB [Candidatus Caldatribacteriota bacterium]